MVNKSKIPSLYKQYEDYFHIGAAVNPFTIKTSKELIKNHFNSITAENEMKFGSLEPEEGVFTFEAADNLMEFAKENDKMVRGHTLVWHNQTSNWLFTKKDGSLTDKETLLGRMKHHIDTVVGRYKGQIYCWDVVNEAVNDSGDTILRDSNWLEIAGESFIDKAFEYAHLADPDALLFYNDYNESDPNKREKIYSLAKGLVEREVPIHGIGMQAHWSNFHPNYDDIKRAIERYASLGLQIHVTEMDVSVFDYNDRRTDLKAPTKEMMAKQAKRYEEFFRIFREYKDVISCVTFWGAADDYTWLHGFPVRGRKNWPLVFDENHQPKESFYKITNI